MLLSFHASSARFLNGIYHSCGVYGACSPYFRPPRSRTLSRPRCRFTTAALVSNSAPVIVSILRSFTNLRPPSRFRPRTRSRLCSTPFSDPTPDPVRSFLSFPVPIFATALVSVSTPVAVPILRSFVHLHFGPHRSRLRCRPRLRSPPPPYPPPPDSDLAPDPVDSSLSLALGYPLDTMHVYRHRALRTDLSGDRVRKKNVCCKIRKNRRYQTCYFHPLPLNAGTRSSVSPACALPVRWRSP